MATDGSKRIDPAGDAAEPRARTAGEQRSEAVASSDDPQVLTAEIERTREELAQTVDAIADRVSPKRVADRTKAQVGDKVQDARTTLSGRAAAAKETVLEKAGSAKGALEEKTATAKAAVSERTSSSSSEPTEGSVAVTGPAASSSPGLRPVRSVPPTSSPMVPPAAAGAVAALVVALLLLRRRRR